MPVSMNGVPCKSQPNCLKRNGTKADSGLVAVDFRAGLALLPFLPMSPGDFKLIINGYFHVEVLSNLIEVT